MAKDEFRDIEWLAVCTSRERATIRRHSDIVEVPAGTVLIREGEWPRWFYAVIEGDATVVVDGNAAGRVGKGEPVNELDVLRNNPAGASVVAETKMRLLVMGRREFLGMLDETPGLTRRLLMPHISQPAAAPAPRPVLVPLPAA